MKTINLTQDKTAKVDEQDFDYLNQWSWCLGAGGYAVRASKKEDGLKKRKHIFMHRVINKTPEEYETDHRNGDRLDNRRENLHSVTRSVNQQNKKKKPVWDKSRNQWIVTLRFDSNKRYFKRFKEYDEALSDLIDKAWTLQRITIR